MKNMGLNNWGNVAFMSVLGHILAFILIWNPAFAGLTIVIWTGAAFIAAGIGVILISLGLRKLKNFPGNLSDELKKLIEAIKAEYHGAVNK
jgi:uncharacterized membrane protein HdeD (DUF308 family)